MANLKEELKEDYIRDKIIYYINYIVDNRAVSIQIVLFTCILIGGYSFFAINKREKINNASELAGLAQDEYNREVSDYIIADLQDVLDSYEKTPGAAQSYVYLIYDSYVNNDLGRLNRLLSDYSVLINDPLINTSLLETNANIALNNSDYDSAIKHLNKALKTNDIFSLKARFSITKARVFIEEGKNKEAEKILNDILNENNNLTSQDRNSAEELLSYIMHR